MYFCILKVTEDFDTDPHPYPDPWVRGTDLGSGSVPTKMSRIRDTVRIQRVPYLTGASVS